MVGTLLENSRKLWDITDIIRSPNIKDILRISPTLAVAILLYSAKSDECPLPHLALSKPALTLGILGPSWGFELPGGFCQQIQPDGRHLSVVVLASK